MCSRRAMTFHLLFYCSCLCCVLLWTGCCCAVIQTVPLSEFRFTFSFFVFQSQESTDTESTSSSSFRLQREPDPVFEELFSTSRDAGVALSTSQLQNLSYPGLEARIREIAAREGVSLQTNHRAFTSITIASRKRSPSPSSSASASPELLHLSELSTDDYSDKRLPPATEEQENPETSRLLYQGSQSLTFQVNPGSQTRQDAIGGHLDKAVPPSEDSGQQDTDTQCFGRDEESSVQFVCDPAHEAKEPAAPSTPESPAHVSHIHLTLSPKTTSHSPTPPVTSPHLDSDSAPKELGPVRQRSSASSPDEGVGLSSPPEWYRNTEPMRPERVDTSTLYRTRERFTSQYFTADHRAVVSPRPQAESPGELCLER